MTTLVEVVADIKTAALSSGFINEVVLIKSEDDMKDIFVSSKFRALYIIVTDADILTTDDFYGISLVVMDKANNNNDDGYLYSLTNGVAALRIISDKLNYSFQQATVDMSGIKFASGVSEGELITIIDAEIEYALDLVPNINVE